MITLIVTGAHPKKVTGGAELQAHLIAKGIRQLERDTIFCTVSRLERDKEEIEENALRNISMHKGRNPIRTILRFKNILAQTAPDVVYIRTLYSLWWISWTCRRLDVPVCYHVSSLYDCQKRLWEHITKFYMSIEWFKGLKATLFHDFQVSHIPYSDAIICQTNEQKNILKKGRLKCPIFVVRNGHPLPIRASRKSEELFNVVWIGKHWKNPSIFVELARKFQDEPRIMFFMAGVFPEEKAYLYRKEMNKLKNFVYLGRLTHDAVNDLLDRSHVLVNTSDYEGFPNTFIQSWMRGVPVVSLKVDADGLLRKERIGFHSQTEEQLEKDLRALAQDVQLYEKISENASVYAIREHNIDKTSVEIWTILKMVSKSC